MSDLQHPDNFPVGYDRGHKATCAWPDCPGGISCEGLSAAENWECSCGLLHGNHADGCRLAPPDEPS